MILPENITVINLHAGMTASKIQRIINEVNKRIPLNHIVIFQFSEEVFILDGTIVFSNFHGEGYLLIQGYDQTRLEFDYYYGSDKIGINISNNDTYVEVKNITTVTDLEQQTAINIENTFSTKITSCRLKGNKQEGVLSTAIKCFNSRSFIENNHISNFHYGIESQASSIHSTNNVSDLPYPNYGLRANQGGSIITSAKQPEGSIANEIINQ